MLSMETKSKLPIIQTDTRILTAAPTASVAPPPPPWIELPDDLTANILQRLGAEEILESAQKVCSSWWRVCKNPAMWRVIDLNYLRCADEEEFKTICHCAVDRSRGQLIELKVTYFEEDYEFLNYVAKRSNQLLRLTLVDYNITAPALVEAIKKLPHLEELHIFMTPSLSHTDFETIGISCPMLKSFTYCQSWIEHFLISHHPVAIGKTMPNLRHLRLFGPWVSNEGLEAILDGCPHLESLDIGGCLRLDQLGALGKRCSEQIKDLRLNSESSDKKQSEHEWGDWDFDINELSDYSDSGLGNDIFYDSDYVSDSDFYYY